MAEPSIEHRAEQPCLAVRGTVTAQTIGAVADRLPGILSWLAGRGIEPAGAPFLRYEVIGAQGELKMAAGVPVAQAVAGDGDVVAGALPAGRYARVTHRGHPEGLPAATAALLGWAADQGLRPDVAQTGQGERWGCRLEAYRTDPREQPDPHRWETDLLIRLAD
ncbi:MAG TPA: GyrI-like domain-containing protein [Micromonosporaceae bacterium]|nr:GyrI-like domain-containing protein [Micromonosporaceae bacterium]